MKNKQNYQVIFFGLVLCFFFTNASLYSGSSPILWSPNQQLEWKDFKGKAPRGSSYEANSALGINTGFQSDGSNIFFSVEAIFIPKQSWTKDKKNAYLLKHEQKHFDLNELYARKLRKALSEFEYSSKQKQQQKDFEKMVNGFNSKKEEVQMRYDKETNHSILKKKQEEWDQFIAKELKEYSDFTSVQFQVILKDN